MRVLSRETINFLHDAAIPANRHRVDICEIRAPEAGVEPKTCSGVGIEYAEEVPFLNLSVNCRT